jgi:hypothetical protein
MALKVEVIVDGGMTGSRTSHRGSASETIAQGVAALVVGTVPPREACIDKH